MTTERADPAEGRPQVVAHRPAAPAPGSRPPIVYVVDGTVVRIRAIEPTGTWHDNDRGYANAPATAPLTELQIAEQFPTLGLRLGEARPRVRGKLREYLPL